MNGTELWVVIGVNLIWFVLSVTGGFLLAAMLDLFGEDLGARVRMVTLETLRILVPVAAVLFSLYTWWYVNETQEQVRQSLKRQEEWESEKAKEHAFRSSRPQKFYVIFRDKKTGEVKVKEY